MDQTSLENTPLASASLLSIGTFSARSRLTPKALRLYDALGLLEPIFTDPSSGYRYYSESQLERAGLIALLRQLEMPLNRIAAVLELRGHEAALEVSHYWLEVESTHREKRGLVQYLQQTLEKREIPMFEVQTRTVPERKLVSIERRVLQNQLPEFIPTSTTALFQRLGAAGLQPSGAPFVVYAGKMNNDSETAVEVCVPFEGSLEPSGEARIRLEQAHQEAFIVMNRGSVDSSELMHGYDALFNWMHQSGKTLILGCREVYFNPADWNSLPAEEPAFDVAAPY